MRRRSVRSNFNLSSGFKIPEIEHFLIASQFAQAISAAKKLLRNYPDNYVAWRLLCEAHMGLRDFDVALCAIERARTLRPSNFHYQKLYAICLKEIGDYQQAKDLLRELHCLQPADLLIIDALKVCHFRLGDEQTARSFGSLKLRLLEKQFSGGTERRELKPLNGSVTGKSVVSFGAWGTQERYCIGAMVNARLVKTLMPGWIARFYVGVDIPAHVISDLRTQGAEIIMPQEVPEFVPNYISRFLVADDLSVCRFVCRDCDSRITIKDVAAVTEWIASPYRYHVMRDHIFHSDLILAGLWGGVSNPELPMTKLIHTFQKASRYDNRYGGDQVFLGSVIWPRIHNDVLSHDSYYRLGNTRPFPFGGKGNDAEHVGAGIVGHEQILADAHENGIELEHLIY